MIVKTLLHAGMCNQLFMIFATIAYALRKNIDYILYSNPTRTLDNGNPVYWDTLLTKIKNKTSNELDKRLPLFNGEKVFHYEPIPMDINQSFNIRGYFQSYKFFEDKYDEIMDITGLNEKRQDIKNEFEYVFKKKCIAIHFRIGDYIGLQMNHPIMPIEYYNKSLKFLETKLNLSEYNILYFCQKIDNERVIKYIENINKERDYTFLKVPDHVPDWKQMLLMSHCEHYIIANSTFSWFGAYMSDNKDKVVCYPSIWFGPALKHDTKDMCPDKWIKINISS